MSARACLLALALLVGSGCGLSFGDGDSPLYDAPWPDERLRRADGTVDVSDLPTGTGVPLRYQLLAALERAPGFGLASAVYFPLDDHEVDPRSLPSVEASLEPSASVFLVDVDPDSPELGRRTPVDVRFHPDPSPFAPARVLSVLPHPGLPLRPDTLYAAVLTTRVRDVDGEPLEASERMIELLEEGSIDDYSEHANRSHRAALSTLTSLEIATESIVDMAVFRTGPDPAAALRADVEQVLAEALPRLAEPPRKLEDHADYCVYQSHVSMPVYQVGRAPYLFEGGQWARDDDGRLVLQRRETARVFFTVPRTPSAAPYPLAVMIRTGGGGDRPLIDRGQRNPSGYARPGSGPALHFAHAGYVGVSVDGPLGGLRNTANWDDQFAIFNVLNMEALRDNVRQSALELALLPHVLEQLEIDARDCEGASPTVRVRSSDIALVGHSMGATIAPLAVAVQPRYGAMILSGAGASWIRQVIYKRSPLPTRGLAEHMLGYALRQHPLSEHDPMLNLLQWGGDAADPQSYARALRERAEPPHVLVFQGLLDTYIPPPVANPLNLSLGLDLAGPALDEAYPEYRSYLADEALGRQRQLGYPVSFGDPQLGDPVLPAARPVTRVVVHHPEDGLEDGHEVLFQQRGAQRQLRCFLETYARGAPEVVAPGDPFLPCPAPDPIR